MLLPDSTKGWEWSSPGAYGEHAAEVWQPGAHQDRSLPGAAHHGGR